MRKRQLANVHDHRKYILSKTQKQRYNVKLERLRDALTELEDQGRSIDELDDKESHFEEHLVSD
jgi:hypothetical protein